MKFGFRRPAFFGRDWKRDRKILNEVVRRIVAVARPDEIILFGSAARGQLKSHSDFDLLVVKAGIQDRETLARQINANFFGIPMPIDVIVVTPEDLRGSRRKEWTFLGRALQEGRRIYRPTAAAR